MTATNGRPHPLLGYATGHMLSDEGPIEWYEDVGGEVNLYPTPGQARAARDRAGADPEQWPAIELRAVPEPPTGGR